MMELIYRYGGVSIDKNVILTESLDWLWSLKNNPHVNMGNPNFQTKYFAFFNANFTSNEEPSNNSHPHPKYFHRSVGLESFFFAGVPKDKFLEKLNKLIYIVLLNPQTTK